MSIQDSSSSAHKSARSVSEVHEALARQQSGTVWRWFVADDLLLRLRCASGNGEFKAAESIGDTKPDIDKQIALFNDAIALAEHEPLLTCIDHWCAAALDWQPLPVDEQVPLSSGSDAKPLIGADVDVTLNALDGPERIVQLALTAERLVNMPAFPAELARVVALDWRQIPVALCIDRFELSVDDIQRLAPGALIVMPASFNEIWYGSIREVAQYGDSTSVQIDAATGELTRIFDRMHIVDTQSASSSDETSSLTSTLSIVLADLISVDVRKWRTGSAARPDLIACGPLCGKRVCLDLITGTSVVEKFTGEVVSLGMGQAVRLLASTTADCA